MSQWESENLSRSYQIRNSMKKKIICQPMSRRHTFKSGIRFLPPPPPPPTVHHRVLRSAAYLHYAACTIIAMAVYGGTVATHNVLVGPSTYGTATGDVAFTEFANNRYRYRYRRATNLSSGSSADRNAEILYQYGTESTFSCPPAPTSWPTITLV